MSQQTTYLLEFANGQAWGFECSESLKKWIKKFAAVMRLTEVDDCQAPRVVIAPIESVRRGDSPALRDSFRDVQIPAVGWRMRDLKLIRLWTHQAVQDVICEMGTESSQELDTVRMRMVLEPIFMQAIDTGALPLHAGLVEREGRGALLAGPSGIGKTTCCLRIPAPWRAHCDDETLVLRDRSRRFVAHPFPTWSDLAWNRCERSWDVQEYFPLTAVFFLEQGEDDAVEPVGKVETAMRLYSVSVAVLQAMFVRLQAREVRLLNRKLFDNACRMAQEIPGHKLKYSRTGRFWDNMERVIFPGCNKRRPGSFAYDGV
jgi:SynChlorMet cassette protein ScmC